MTYQPREDSLLLDSYLEDRVLEGKKVLDMGTGSGILAVTAAEQGAEVTAVDIDPEALEDAREHAREESTEGIEFVESDLFENVDSKFDLIIFNPPYLQGEDYLALEGGEKGIELTSDFLEQAPDYLEEGGEVVFVASSRADTDSLREEFDLEQVGERKLWFETLYLFKSD
ncbi:MAG: HemK2/MTQ2 family protein methyltransferase [Candidatus Nanohaloarchaea archaeon]